MRVPIAPAAFASLAFAACTSFGTLGEPLAGDAGESGLPSDASSPDAPSSDAARQGPFCSRKPAHAVFCADFEPGAPASEDLQDVIPEGADYRRIAKDEDDNSALELDGAGERGARVRVVVPPDVGYTLTYRAQVRAVSNCSYLAFGGFLSTFGPKDTGGFFVGAALYAGGATAFSLNGAKFEPSGEIKDLQPGPRWYDIRVEVNRPATPSNMRGGTVRIDGVEAPGQAANEPADPRRVTLAVDFGRVSTNACGAVTLRFDDILIVKRE